MGELSHHPERRCLLFMLPGARASAVTDFGQKQASCLFHGLALNLCQDFQENRKRICSIYETKALSEFPGLVCHMEMSCSVALFPLISPPRIWFRALLFPHIKTWWGFSGVFVFFVTRGDILVCQHFQALHCHSILVARTVSLAKHSES